MNQSHKKPSDANGSKARSPIRPELASLYEDVHALAQTAAGYDLPPDVYAGIRALHRDLGELAYGSDGPCAYCTAEKLVHYAGRPLTPFLQLDGFGDRAKGECMIDPNGTGEAVMGGVTRELMHGPEIIRVLIPLDAPKAKVLALLEKIRGWIKDDYKGIGRERSGTVTRCNHETPSGTYAAQREIARKLVEAVEATKSEVSGEEIPF